jgi:hypothetical protein
MLVVVVVKHILKVISRDAALLQDDGCYLWIIPHKVLKGRAKALDTTRCLGD